MRHARVRQRWLPLALPLLAGMMLVAWRLAVPAGGVENASVLGAARTDGGLQLALSVPRWPFFRHELVPVSLVLTNHSGHALSYYGYPTVAALCGESALTAHLSQGGQGLVPLGADLGLAMSCPPPGLNTLPPGATLRLRFLLGLPAAGTLTLSAQAQLDPSARVQTPGLPAPGGSLAGLRRLLPFLFRSSHAPFAAGWPSLRLWVSPRIPDNRQLHLIRQGHRVWLRASEQALHGLVVQQASLETAATGASGPGPWACFSSPGTAWQPLPASGVSERLCGTDYSSDQWTVAIGAPGYAIGAEVYCFTTGHQPFTAAPGPRGCAAGTS